MLFLESRPVVSSRSKPPFGIDDLREIAGHKVFGRGEDYFLEKRVSVVGRTANTIRAEVRGTAIYEVRLRIGKGLTSHACTCPAADGGDLCKHGVAVGLARLAELRAGPSKAARKEGEPLTLGDLREPLEKLAQGALVELVLDHALTDARLERRLIAAVAARAPKGANLAELRRQIDRAVEVDDFIAWGESGAYAAGVQDCVDMLDDLLKRGQASEVIELSERALRGLEDALNSIDDSDGCIQPIREDLERLHLAACRKAKPDQLELAARLFEWELESEWDGFRGAAETYARVLGAAGLAEYGRCAARVWSKVRAPRPGDSDAERFGERSRITHIMQSLADAAGDLAAWIAVAEKDLSTAWCFVRIAEKCRASGADDLALEWAERGAQEFTRDTDSRLLEFLASEYARRARHEDVVSVRRRSFEQTPSPEMYAALEKAATRAKCWPVERERAFEFLRREAKRGDPTRLVRVLIHEGELDQAWSEVQRGRCSAELAFDLAQRREKEHPRDALPIYLERIELSIERRNDDGYRYAVELLARVRVLHERLGTGPEFEQLVDGVRKRHGAKRNLMRMLDRALASLLLPVRVSGARPKR